jgi:hypothetical protein
VEEDGTSAILVLWWEPGALSVLVADVGIAGK